MRFYIWLGLDISSLKKLWVTFIGRNCPLGRNKFQKIWSHCWIETFDQYLSFISSRKKEGKIKKVFTSSIWLNFAMIWEKDVFKVLTILNSWILKSVSKGFEALKVPFWLLSTYFQSIELTFRFWQGKNLKMLNKDGIFI